MKNAIIIAPLFDADAATAVKVPLAVKVCIVCPPLVVTVHQVEDGEIPSLPSVAYESITTQLPQFPHKADHNPIELPPPHPPPVQSVPFAQSDTRRLAQFPHPHSHHVQKVPALSHVPPPHPPA
jgi:hypothetical protein